MSTLSGLQREQEIKEELAKLEKREQEIMVQNMPKFERGVAEASLEREGQVWRDLSVVFAKHKISPSVAIKLASDKVESADPHRPGVACGGVMVTLVYRVMPMDENGLDGSMEDDALEEVGKIRKDRNDLLEELKNSKK